MFYCMSHGRNLYEFWWRDMNVKDLFNTELKKNFVVSFCYFLNSQNESEKLFNKLRWQRCSSDSRFFLSIQRQQKTGGECRSCLLFLGKTESRETLGCVGVSFIHVVKMHRSFHELINWEKDCKIAMKWQKLWVNVALELANCTSSKWAKVKLKKALLLPQEKFSRGLDGDNRRVLKHSLLCFTHNSLLRNYCTTASPYHQWGSICDRYSSIDFIIIALLKMMVK